MSPNETGEQQDSCSRLNQPHGSFTARSISDTAPHWLQQLDGYGTCASGGELVNCAYLIRVALLPRLRGFLPVVELEVVELAVRQRAGVEVLHVRAEQLLLLSLRPDPALPTQAELQSNATMSVGSIT